MSNTVRNGIKFEGVRYTHPNMPQKFKELFGFEMTGEGSDWVIPNNDPVLRQGPKSLMSLSRQIALEPNKFSEIAKEMIYSIPNEFDNIDIASPEKINVTSGYGLISNIEYINVKIQICKNEELYEIVKNELLKFMYEEMRAKYVTVIHLKSVELQKYTSFAKISLLNVLGKLNEPYYKTLDRRVLGGILPININYLSYIEAYCVLSPLAISLPIRRWGSMWHFHSDRSWFFPNAALKGFLGQFYMPLNPMGSDPNMLSTSDLAKMAPNTTWQYLRVITKSVDKLIRYIVDFRNFVNDDGVVDYMRMIQSHSATHLIYSDLNGMNYSTSSHNRITFAFSAMDKISNFYNAIGKSKFGEEEIFVYLMSDDMRDCLREIFVAEILPISHDVFNILDSILSSTYSNIKKYISEQFTHDCINEKGLLTKIRWMRNVYSHGVFLKKDQFKNIFLEGEGVVPEYLSALPHLLVLGMALDTKKFIGRSVKFN